MPRTPLDKPLVSGSVNDASNHSEIARTNILPSNWGSLVPRGLLFQLEDPHNSFTGLKLCSSMIDGEISKFLYQCAFQSKWAEHIPCCRKVWCSPTPQPWDLVLLQAASMCPATNLVLLAGNLGVCLGFSLCPFVSVPCQSITKVSCFFALNISWIFLLLPISQGQAISVSPRQRVSWCACCSPCSPPTLHPVFWSCLCDANSVTCWWPSWA